MLFPGMNYAVYNAYRTLKLILSYPDGLLPNVLFAVVLSFHFFVMIAVTLLIQRHFVRLSRSQWCTEAKTKLSELFKMGGVVPYGDIYSKNNSFSTIRWLPLCSALEFIMAAYYTPSDHHNHAKVLFIIWHHFLGTLALVNIAYRIVLASCNSFSLMLYSPSNA